MSLEQKELTAPLFSSAISTVRSRVFVLVLALGKTVLFSCGHSVKLNPDDERCFLRLARPDLSGC